jgi:enoyl-CoA hydratase
MSDSEPDLLVEQREHTLILTMNRPKAMNAFSAEMMDLLGHAWDRVNSDDSIRVAILTGADGKFCAGADLKAMTRQHPGERFSDQDAAAAAQAQANADAGVIKPLLRRFRLRKPLIAAVEGPAIAGGTEILQATDIRVAGEGAKFGVSEVRWGLFPLGGSTVRLRRQIPYALAADILLTGRHITAEEACRIGLITYLVPDGQALAKALEVADLIAGNGPVAVQAVLRSLRETEGLPEDEALQVENRIGREVFKTDDAREGPRAFLEKRKPAFVGR